jgi:hypothetical protein
MNKSIAIIFAASLASAALMPGQAEARVFVSIGLGGCCWYGPRWGYPYYYPPYYPTYYSSPVVYAAPPPSVVYAAPSPSVVYAPSPATAYVPPATLQANQASPAFVDSLGRTCRQFQSTSAAGAFSGTACMQADGSWRIVQ